MKISIEDLREAAGAVGEAGGAQAAIVAQFVVDLAVTAQFTATGDDVRAPREAHDWDELPGDQRVFFVKEFQADIREIWRRNRLEKFLLRQ
jgi:hypothetical protein